ncbi:MAG: metallophosphoesterase family protein [Acidiferrobacterales bacterium]
MRIAHMSDLHYASSTLKEVDKCFGFAVDRAIEAGVDAAIISGDSTDHELGLHAPAVSALAGQIHRLADYCPVLMLQGTFSHEPPGTLDVFRLLGGRFPIQIVDRIGQVALVGNRWVSSPSWIFESFPENTRLLVSGLPTVNKGVLAGVAGVADAAQAVGAAITDVLAGWGAVNKLARAAGIPTAGVSHGTVSGCLTEHDVPMAGLDHEFTSGTLFTAETSAFMLGHIHKQQQWERDGRLVSYAGSIGRLHYGEEGPKGFLLWDVGVDGAQAQFVETPARRMVHLDFAGLPDIEAIRKAATAANGAFVRVRWEVSEEQRDAVDRGAIESLLGAAAEVHLEGRIIPKVRSRAEGILRANTLAEQVGKWCEVTETSPEGLNERLDALSYREPEDIAAEILQ